MCLSVQTVTQRRDAENYTHADTYGSKNERGDQDFSQSLDDRQRLVRVLAGPAGEPWCRAMWSI